ncbi:MAG: alginate export family protein [Acidobacteriota bacterium]
MQYDYASGDRRPGSGVSNAFDPLFGVRRTDLGTDGNLESRRCARISIHRQPSCN